MIQGNVKAALQVLSTASHKELEDAIRTSVDLNLDVATTVLVAHRRSKEDSVNPTNDHTVTNSTVRSRAAAKRPPPKTYQYCITTPEDVVTQANGQRKPVKANGHRKPVVANVAGRRKSVVANVAGNTVSVKAAGHRNKVGVMKLLQIPFSAVLESWMPTLKNMILRRFVSNASEHRVDHLDMDTHREISKERRMFDLLSRYSLTIDYAVRDYEFKPKLKQHQIDCAFDLSRDPNSQYGGLPVKTFAQSETKVVEKQTVAVNAIRRGIIDIALIRHAKLAVLETIVVLLGWHVGTTIRLKVRDMREAQIVANTNARSKLEEVNSLMREVLGGYHGEYYERPLKQSLIS